MPRVIVFPALLACLLLSAPAHAADTVSAFWQVNVSSGSGMTATLEGPGLANEESREVRPGEEAVIPVPLAAPEYAPDGGATPRRWTLRLGESCRVRFDTPVRGMPVGLGESMDDPAERWRAAETIEIGEREGCSGLQLGVDPMAGLIRAAMP
ncbi:hypothetical protein [Desulfohalovibrio reitneri]|uniref:hypothetical protein n=1 Tax=Desulfohalovibrio reitneri TaxID=1307759 RepID=UPI0004A720C5|nr:hypothetical protein [Desulfohalovibrio reitneri]